MGILIPSIGLFASKRIDSYLKSFILNSKPEEGPIFPQDSHNFSVFQGLLLVGSRLFLKPISQHTLSHILTTPPLTYPGWFVSFPSSFSLPCLCLCHSLLLDFSPFSIISLGPVQVLYIQLITSVCTLNYRTGCFFMKYDSIVPSLELSSNYYPMQQNEEQITARSCLLALYFLINYLLLCRNFLITLSLTLNIYQSLHKYLITGEIWKNQN